MDDRGFSHLRYIFASHNKHKNIRTPYCVRAVAAKIATCSNRVLLLPRRHSPRILALQGNFNMQTIAQSDADNFKAKSTGGARCCIRRRNS